MGSPYLVRFLPMRPFFNPTIEVVTFHLRGWRVLGMVLLPAFIRLGHECQDLSNQRCTAWVHRLDLRLHSHLKEFKGSEVRTHVNSKGTIPSTGGSEKGWKCEAASRRTANPTHHQPSYGKVTNFHHFHYYCYYHYQHYHYSFHY